MRENPRGRNANKATPQVVIMAPTRELVTQIYDEARKFSGGSELMVANVYGGTSVFQQLQALDRGCNILVAAPGRLLDFVERGKISFESVQYLVLDEVKSISFLNMLKFLFPRRIECSTWASPTKLMPF